MAGTLDELDAMTDSQLHAWSYDRPAASAELLWPDWDLVLADIQAGNNRTEAYDLFLDRVGEGKPIADRTFRDHLGPLLDEKNPTMRLLHRPGDKTRQPDDRAGEETVHPPGLGRRAGPGDLVNALRQRAG